MRKHWRFVLVLFLFLAAASGVALILSRFSPTRIKLPPCFFHELTGIYCPGCGSTRATRRLLCGDVVGAFRYNPLLVVLLPPLAIQIVLHFYDLWHERFPYRRGSLTVAFVYLALVVVFMIARNLPFDCCEWLRPPAGPCP